MAHLLCSGDFDGYYQPIMRQKQTLQSFIIIILITISPSLASAEGMRFGWQLPATAVVTQTKVDRGVKVKLKYTLSAQAISEQQVLLKISEVEIISINEQLADKIQLPPQTKALISALPSYVVSHETGQLVSIVGFDEMIASIIDTFSDIDSKPQMEAFFKNPQINYC